MSIKREDALMKALSERIGNLNDANKTFERMFNKRLDIDRFSKIAYKMARVKSLVTLTGDEIYRLIAVYSQMIYIMSEYIHSGSVRLDSIMVYLNEKAVVHNYHDGRLAAGNPLALVEDSFFYFEEIGNDNKSK